MAQVRKKTWLLDQTLVNRVRRIYRARTETEAVTLALRETVLREELTEAFRQSAGKIPRLEQAF
jgi:Arc/MetJ family transcription regulator